MTPYDPHYSGKEKRDVDNVARYKRLRRGTVGGSTIAAPAVILVWYLESKGAVLPNYVVIAIGALIGSVSATVAICFEDLRTIFLAMLIDRFPSLARLLESRIKR